MFIDRALVNLLFLKQLHTIVVNALQNLIACYIINQYIASLKIKG